MANCNCSKNGSVCLCPVTPARKEEIIRDRKDKR